MGPPGRDHDTATNRRAVSRRNSVPWARPDLVDVLSARRVQEQSLGPLDAVSGQLSVRTHGGVLSPSLLNEMVEGLDALLRSGSQLEGLGFGIVVYGHVVVVICLRVVEGEEQLI